MCVCVRAALSKSIIITPHNLTPFLTLGLIETMPHPAICSWFLCSPCSALSFMTLMITSSWIYGYILKIYTSNYKFLYPFYCRSNVLCSVGSEVM